MPFKMVTFWWISSHKGWKRTFQLMARESNQEIFEMFELTSSWWPLRLFQLKIRKLRFCWHFETIKTNHPGIFGWQTHGGKWSSGRSGVLWMQGSTFDNSSLKSGVFKKWPEVEVPTMCSVMQKIWVWGFLTTTTTTAAAAAATTTTAAATLLLLLFPVLLLLLMIGYSYTITHHTRSWY